MEPRLLLDDNLIRVIEVLGILAFATSGALKAIRLDFDIVGIVILAWITAFGGGVVRDLMIGETPPAALTDVAYFLLPLLAAAVTSIAHTYIRRWFKPVLLFDAVGLALFTVVGTLKAIEAGLNPVPAASLGVITGVGGGLLRDVIAREVPAVVRADAELYAVPAIAGALVVAFTAETDLATPLAMVAIGLILVVRILALAFGWHAPRALRSRGRRNPATTNRDDRA